MKEIKVFSPASIANLSCGYDILGVCLDNVGDEITVKKTRKKGITIKKVTGEKLSTDISINVAGVSASALLNETKVDCGFEIEIHKGIKPGSGIGSSAASAAGAVFAINELLGRPYSRNGLVKFAMAGESLASGDAHADNLAPVLLGGFTLVRSNKALDIIKLPSPKNLVATIIHPKIELKTIHSRAILKNEIPLKKAVEQWGNLGAFISALYTNDYGLLSRSMKDKIIEPIRAMLIPKFNDIKHAAIDAGALGSGISGSGPSVYSLSKGETKAKKVGQAIRTYYDEIGLDYEVHYSRINNEGIKIL
jgi:homoserine kinase